MPGRVFRHVFTDEIQIVAPPADKGFEFACDHGQNLEKFIRRFYARIDNDFAGERYPPRLGKKCKWKAGRQAETLLLVTPAALKAKLDVSRQFGARWYVRKVGCPLKDGRQYCGLRNSLQFVIAKLQPLLFRRTARRNRKLCRHPLPM